MKRIILAALLLFPEQSAACYFGVDVMTTFFAEIPIKLGQQPMVARVKIIRAAQSWDPPREISSGWAFPMVSIKFVVIEAVRGAVVGDMFSVVLPMNSCVTGQNVKLGSDWFVTGRLREGRFVGSWSRRDIDRISATIP